MKTLLCLVEILIFLVIVDWSKVDTVTEIIVAGVVIILLLATLAGLGLWSDYRKNARI